MLTGHGDEMVAVELMKAGAADYLPKAKLSPEALARTLRNAVRVRRAEAEAARAESERGRLMENLAAEQGQLEAVLTSMTDGLVVSDLDGNVLAMNPAALTMLGYHTPDEIRRPLHEFADTLALTTPDGRELGVDEWPLSRALRGETFSDFEVNMRRRDTGRAWAASFGGTPVRGRTGEAILAIVTMHDITAIKQAQRRAAFLADAGAILASSLEVQTTLKNVVQLAASRLVDGAPSTSESRRGLSAFWRRHTPILLRSRAAWKLQRLYASDPEAAFGVGYVLRTGKAQLIEDVTEDILSTRCP